MDAMVSMNAMDAMDAMLAMDAMDAVYATCINYLCANNGMPVVLKL
jgi:hypothetical protein